MRGMKNRYEGKGGNPLLRNPAQLKSYFHICSHFAGMHLTSVCVCVCVCVRVCVCVCACCSSQSLIRLLQQQVTVDWKRGVMWSIQVDTRPLVTLLWFLLTLCACLCSW